MSNKSRRDTTASPGAPGAPQMRSIYERMTNPTPADLDVGARVAALGRNDIDRLVNHLGQALEHIAAQRDDLTVKRAKDPKGWTIRVEMT